MPRCGIGKGLQAQIKVVRDRHLWTNALSACAKASARRAENVTGIWIGNLVY